MHTRPALVPVTQARQGHDPLLAAAEGVYLAIRAMHDAYKALHDVAQSDEVKAMCLREMACCYSDKRSVTYNLSNEGLTLAQ